MILLTAVGFAVRWFGGPTYAVYVGLFSGLLFAPMVPKQAKGRPS